MYKLFLCLRYLRSRVLAYFAAISVALCVAMMVGVVSVMDGFLYKIETAAKGLFGDIVIESNTLSGLGYYDPFIAELKQKVPEVQEASPWIFTYGILRLPNSDWRQTVQVAGIRLPERAKVTDFSKGLFVQGGWQEPSFDPPVSDIMKRLEQDEDQIMHLTPKKGEMTGVAIRHHELGKDYIEHAAETDKRIASLEAEYKKAESEGADDVRLKTLQDEINILSRQRFLPPSDRMILGLGIPGLTSRTSDGKTIRYLVPGQQLVLTLIPLGRNSISEITPTNKPFSIVDDCRTDVSSIDSSTVYVPFETLQALNDMGADEAEPARCSAIHIKVKGGGLGDEKRLAEIRDRIQGLWKDFLERHPDAERSGVSIKTWRERQEMIISSISAQRTLVVILFALISSVAIVLVFVLFYTIVVQKTKDIGVVKAIGGSSSGVAQIFLAYGAAIGFVGSIFGVIGGYFFVHYINEIQDWTGRTFGFVVWSKESFLFEKIPNDVRLVPTLMIVVAAIVAGIIGAMLPAIKAARMQPVEALRYE